MTTLIVRIENQWFSIQGVIRIVDSYSSRLKYPMGHDTSANKLVNYGCMKISLWLITRILGHAYTYQNTLYKLYNFQWKKNLQKSILSYNYMINILPLEISIIKYQTSSSELLEMLNQYVKCQEDIVKYIPWTVKEHSPEYSHWRVLQSTKYATILAGSESPSIKIQNLLNLKVCQLWQGNYQNRKMQRMWDIALSWLIYYQAGYIIR